MFLKRWKDSRQFEESFECLSAECAEVLGVEQDLAKRDFRELIDMDYFCVIDQKIISDLVKAVAGRTVSRGDVALWVRDRRQSHWYGNFRYLYEGIDYAARFLDELTMVDNQGELKGDNASEWSLATWIERYSKSWFNLDQLYRKFCYSVRMSGKASLMGELTDQVENLYSTNYLLRLNDRFQTAVDSIDEWDIPGALMQRRFYQDVVKAVEGKVCVIVSDALRYEIGEELSGNIRSANKYKVELNHIVGSLPSYTQLGMASLLPHSRLEFSSDNAGQVLADGQSTNGLKAREKLLQRDCPESTALKAEDVFALRRDDLRAVCRDNRIIYVFHDSIDAVGDDLKSEDKVFEAAQSAIGEIKRIITKLGGENYILNFLVTSDHGFVYQNTRIDESDFSGTDAQGSAVLCRNRRFVIGKGLEESSSLKKFTAAQLGVEGDWEVQIPKSINRLRLKGSGSRFVHGGASLQELVLPLLRISKKRPSDIAKVDVNILRGNTNIITSGQLAVGFYQEQAMTDKVQPRVLRAGIYTEDGELISDSHEITFDLESENPRDRELPVRFVLSSKADEMNDQEVILKLEERHAGTSHYKEYRSLRYQLRRSFTSDFEF